MQVCKKIFRSFRNAMAIYGTACLISGVTVDMLERKWHNILDETEDRLCMWLTGKPKERPIEVEFEEVG